MEKLNYITYNMDCKETGKGTLDLDIEHSIELDTHGSISIEIAENKWISFTTSEWSYAYFATVPVTHDGRKE